MSNKALDTKEEDSETMSIVEENKNFPEFSWDKIPLYMHVRKKTAYTNDEIEYLSKFPLITIEKSTGYETFGSNEAGTLETAKAIKSINPNTKILYYKNVVINWGNYEEDELFLEEHPEAYLRNDDEEKSLMPNGVTPFFDISQEIVQNYWLSHVKRITESTFIDGAFLDANIKVLVPSFFGNKVGEDKQQEIEAGYFTMLQNLNTQIGEENLLIANIIRVRPEFEDTGREFLKYFNGSYIEGFDNESFGMTYADYLVAGIEAVQKSAREGNVIAMSLGIGEAIDGSTIGIDDVRESVELEGNLNDRIDYLLAIFLVCAEKYSYIYPHDGFNSLTSAVWLKTFSQYEKNLGEPTGYAIQDGYIYTRSFEYLDVWLDIENQQAKLNWK
ncbi:putative glycoside hydrolase [Wenyingzhuangia sp. 2_MG-2023]|uniref:putative glycoside hydrolase n=1 Tax=Wenyingzhuangia sp. 2_MG-2023 TaxID=3062639 RepID=UPI0026E19AF0|nr:putative glycoside hydrolase [Wenyingzhuangia sp. 2_MG-2023]